MLSQVVDLPNLYAAFVRVQASRGMAGVDGVTLARFRENLELNLVRLAGELVTGAYEPLPLLRFLVAKTDGTPRALVVPAVRDRIAQAAVLNVIEPLFEAHFEDVSFAYRKGRSVKQAAWRLKELRDRGYRYLVDADIDDFFNQINHDLLFHKISQVVSDRALLRLLRMWVKAEIYDGKGVFPLKKGIPQGSVISPLLANLFLDELDEALLARGYQVVRYADDFVILTKTRPEAEAALEFTEEVLDRLGLKLDDDDTTISAFQQGFKFLGLIFLKDSILVPFDRPPKKKKVLYMPPPFDLEAYLARKRQGP